MEKRYRLNTDSGVLHVIGKCYQTTVNIARCKDYETEEEARLEYGEKVHRCKDCKDRLEMEGKEWKKKF